MLRRIVLETKS